MPREIEAPPAVAPQVAVFYYAWYGTPRLDGAWLHWGQGAIEPPQGSGRRTTRRAGRTRRPTRAPARRTCARSRRPGSTRSSCRGGDRGRPRTYVFAPSRRARSAGLEVALHVEPWDGRTPSGVVDALRGMNGLGIRDVYVYDSTSDRRRRVADGARAARRRDARLRAHALAGKARKGGFQGLYTYDVLIYDGRSFRRMCNSAPPAEARLRAVGRARVRRVPGDRGLRIRAERRTLVRPHVGGRGSCDDPTS